MMSKQRTINDVDYWVHFAAGAYGSMGSAALEVKDGNSVETLGRMDVRANGTIVNAVSGKNIIEDRQKILWSGVLYMDSNHSITLSESVSAQNVGIILVWSAYSNGEAGNYNWVTTFVPKQWVSLHNANGVVCRMSGTNFSTMGCKYVYVGNTAITGNSVNVASGTGSGITYANTSYVLRYVIGV